jgi:DMSO/TMAO reductase YedYZ molybdopterin-dependent catalytic subunit
MRPCLSEKEGRASFFRGEVRLMALRKTMGLLGLMIAGAITGIAAAQTAAPAADTVALVVKGAVKQELRLTAADLKAMPRAKATAKDHDGAAHEFEGVALQAVLAKAGVPQGGDLRGKNMTLCVVAEAGDGYHAAFSLAETDGDFAGEQVIVVDTVDGKSLGMDAGPLRLVVPGDKRQARWVKMLKGITVLKAGE